MTMEAPNRREAIRRLTEERDQVLALMDRLPPRALARPGIGGGAWSPKDLIGHLESWEEHALAAIEAWGRDEPAPIDRALREQGLTRVNLAEVDRKARRSATKALASAAATRERLLRVIRDMPAERWNAPATSRGQAPLGRRVGQILVGTRHPFAHDSAHVKSLAAFVEVHGRSSR